MRQSRLPDSEKDERDDAAVALAEKWWPERYVGDLTAAEWDRVYAAIDRGER